MITGTAIGSSTGAATRAPSTDLRERRLPDWVRWVFPSITDLLFMILFFTLTYGTLSPRLLGDADTGWHIRNGQHIIATRAIPRTDYFSYTLPGHTWYLWEWLYDIVAGLLDARLGLNCVVLLSAVVIAGVFAFVFRMAL